MSSDPDFDPLAGILVSSHRVERIAARARDVAHTFSAWALSVHTAQGPGRIVRIELTPETTLWRGDGVFLGWTTERLVAAWDALRAAEPETESSPDFPQLG
ncbi:MAG TPA: hypothetical protein PLB01_03550 [Thermoanaerobaculia bacterium]|nr:hypothetical protein [Thermoanaerobaculia bacterium]